MRCQECNNRMSTNDTDNGRQCHDCEKEDV